MSARRTWAWPLVPVYATVSRLAQKLKARRPKKLFWPVVSIGSLSAGGAGKTPVVIALAQLLAECEWQVDVLSRGYGRLGDGVEQVKLAKSDRAADASWFGDEPVMIAQATGAAVWVGRERFLAGVAAETEAGVMTSESAHEPVHLLDDGFQHVQLARTLDVVLITKEDLEDALLPAGNLRESLAALERADVVVVRAEELEAIESNLRPRMRADTAIWVVRRKLTFDGPLKVLEAGLRPLGFCAIARPVDFAHSVLDAGCGLVDVVAFDDHHRYTLADVEQIIETAKKYSATGFVTTEKDAVKLDATMLERLATIGPVTVPKLRVEFADREAVARLLEERLR